MRTHYHFFHLPHHKSRLSLLYFVATLRTFIFGFFSLFIPILIFQNYLFLGEKDALIITICFFILHSFVHLLSVTLTVKLASKFGLKTTFFIGQLLLLVLFGLMINQSYFWGAIIFGLASSFWWFSYHFSFVDLGQTKKLGHEVGTVQALGILACIVAPILGGTIINFSSDLIFYLSGMVLIAISLITILFFDQLEKVNPISIGDIKNEFKTRKNDFLAFIGGGAEEIIYSVAWPLMLFYIFRNMLTLAGFSSLVMLVASVVYYITGYVVDHTSKEKLEKIGVLSVSSSWLGKALFQTPLTLSIFDVFHKVLSSLFIIPLMTLTYQHAKADKEKYVAFREVGWKLGNIFAMAIFALIILFNLPFWLIFITAALFSILPMKIKK